MIGREDEVRGYRDRVGIFHVIMVLMMGVILGRLFYLQILKGDELRKFSEANRLKKEKLTPARGIIYDRDGKVIVDNRAAFDVVLLSQYYPFDDATNERLAKALGMSRSELERKLAKVDRAPSFYPVLLKGDASKDVIAAIEMDAQGFPGVDIEPTVQRRYPYGDISAQLLGYIGEVDPRDIKNDSQKQFTPGDYIGKMGIERKYDNYLRGQNGVGYVEVDAMGRRRKTETNEKLLGFVAQTEPVAGDNIYLTLDADIELAASHAMKSRQLTGSVVALDPRTGEVLAIVNEPSYDPSLISGRDVDPKVWTALRTNEDRPLRDRAVQDHYPPGSTFKPLLALAGMAEGRASPSTTVQCPGFWVFGNRKFNCWHRHGTIDLIHAIKESCDVFFYKLGNELGVDTIAKYARLFGLGSATGIGVPGETRGLIPDSQWKLKTYHDIWHPGETLSVAIGQGYVDVSPIQMVTAYAAISNGGFLYKPSLVKKIVSRNGEIIKEFQPELTRKIEIAPEIFNTVKEGMFKVINEPGGTAFLSKSKITVISGKTGTAQIKTFANMAHLNCFSLPVKERHHAWFIGYAPMENPEIAVVTIAEHACHGYVAAHVVKDIIEAYMLKKAQKTAAAAAALSDMQKLAPYTSSAGALEKSALAAGTDGAREAAGAAKSDAKKTGGSGTQPESPRAAALKAVKPEVTAPENDMEDSAGEDNTPMNDDAGD